MASCEALMSIDLTPLGNVTNIGSKFMRHCKSITTIELASSWLRPH